LFVTRVAVRRQWRELALLVVTGEAHRVSEQPYFEAFVLRLRRFVAISARRVCVLLMRKGNVKLRNKTCALSGREKWHAETRKRISRRVDGRRFHMAVGTDLRNRSLTREELLSMTIQTGAMFGKLRYIRKRRVAFADLLPVFGWELVTRVTCEFFFGNVS